VSFPPEQDAPEPDAAEAAADPPVVPVTPADAPPPIPTGFPPPAEEGTAQSGGVAVTDTGTAVYPQPMEPARPGHVNLATVPPMTELHVPPLEAGGESVTIDVYGTEVDDATAERAYAAAQAAGLTLREL
jgi:hypothetical protein